MKYYLLRCSEHGYLRQIFCSRIIVIKVKSKLLKKICKHEKIIYGASCSKDGIAKPGVYIKICKQCGQLIDYINE